MWVNFCGSTIEPPNNQFKVTIILCNKQMSELASEDLRLDAPTRLSNHGFYIYIKATCFFKLQTTGDEGGSGGRSSSVARKRTTKDGFGGIICESSNWQDEALRQLRLNQSCVVPQSRPVM